MEHRVTLTLRIVPGRHYEAIASFFLNNEPWATPLGFKVTSDKKVILKVYRGTRTYTAIIRGVDVVLNITRDPSLYLYTSFKNIYTEWKRMIRFEKSRRVNAPRIANVEAYIELQPLCIEYHGEIVKALYTIVDTYIGNPKLEPLTRCVNHIIDAIIYLTKLRDIRDKNLREKYMILLAMSMEIIRKTCDVNMFNLVSEIERIYRKVMGETEHSGPR